MGFNLGFKGLIPIPAPVLESVFHFIDEELHLVGPHLGNKG